MRVERKMNDFGLTTSERYISRVRIKSDKLFRLNCLCYFYDILFCFLISADTLTSKDFVFDI